MMDWERSARLFRGPRNGEVLAVEAPTLKVAVAKTTNPLFDDLAHPTMTTGRYELRIRDGKPVILKDGNYAFDWQGWDKPPKPKKAKLTGLQSIIGNGKSITINDANNVAKAYTISYDKAIEELKADLKAKVIANIQSQAPIMEKMTSISCS